MRNGTWELQIRSLTKKQPFSYRQTIKTGPSDFGDFQYLGRTLLAEQEEFPFQKAIALYCLFIRSIWTEEREEHPLGTPPQKAREAARLLCGIFNFLMDNPPRGPIKINGESKPYDVWISDNEVHSLNEKFFRLHGGLSSLTWTARADTFFAEVWEQYHSNLMMHDVIEFLLKASISFPEATRSDIAFEAVAANIFNRPADQGVIRKAAGQAGQHKKVLEQAGLTDGRAILITPKGVRERWRSAPDTILLSYTTSICYGWLAHPVDSTQLVQLVTASRSPSVQRMLAIYNIVRKHLPQRIKKNKKNSINAWAKPLIDYSAGSLMFSPFTEDQRNLIVQLAKMRLNRDLANTSKPEPSRLS
jgi:hypothetical protein